MQCRHRQTGFGAPSYDNYNVPSEESVQLASARANTFSSNRAMYQNKTAFERTMRDREAMQPGILYRYLPLYHMSSNFMHRDFITNGGVVMLILLMFC
eukprot:sb/3478861/